MGLFEAILDSAFEHVLSGIRDLAAADGADGEHFAARFVPLYMRTLASQPWIPHLIGREVLSADTKVRVVACLTMSLAMFRFRKRLD